jgi:hypothetical protein
MAAAHNAARVRRFIGVLTGKAAMLTLDQHEVCPEIVGQLFPEKGTVRFGGPPISRKLF